MTKDKIAVVTSTESWFVPYAESFVERLSGEGVDVRFYSSHKDVDLDRNIVFLLSYFHIVEEAFLKVHDYVLVVHESDLPKGKGWSPLFWQILEGKNKIPIVLFKAEQKQDAGGIYSRDYVELDGTELNGEIRKKQAEKTLELCLRFLRKSSCPCLERQQGCETHYAKRTPKDSELFVNKTIEDQFDLLRIVDNKNFPAFFKHKKHTYILSIRKADEGELNV